MWFDGRFLARPWCMECICGWKGCHATEKDALQSKEIHEQRGRGAYWKGERMSKEPKISIASDYAVLEAGDYSFYFGYEYGYERDEGEIWGFRAKHRGKVVLEYPVEDGKFDVTEGLLEGVG